MMVLDTVFVTNDLAVELVNQRIDGGVQILFDRFDVDIVATYAQGDFGSLPYFFRRQLHAGIDHLIKMALDSGQFGGYVSTQRRRNVHIVSVDRKVHAVPFNRWLTLQTLQGFAQRH